MSSDLERHLETQMRQVGITDFAEEHTFHPGRKWRFDFAFIDRKIAIECEGGTWSGGRHTRGSGFEKDCWKYNQAAIDGWLVLRYTGDMITSGKAVAQIEEIIKGVTNE